MRNHYGLAFTHERDLSNIDLRFDCHLSLEAIALNKFWQTLRS